MANIPSTPDREAVRRALELARSSADGQIEPRVNTVLENAIRDLWRTIQSHPDTYVLTRDEFALFNYYRERYRNSSVARRVVERYWNSPQASRAEVDGCIQRGSPR